jgi:hypothetical protein
MYIYKSLSKKERDEILSQLSETQKVFLQEKMKRGRKTVFTNVLAKEKASSFDDDQDGENVALKWDLLDYLDGGPNWRTDTSYYCECGRQLRYQYIIKNLETNEIKKFGLTHFEVHTGIPANLAKAVKDGIDAIDFELDEILQKIDSGWNISVEGIHEIPQEIEIPNDIKEHFENDVPLLDRQVFRLKEKIYEHKRQQEWQQRQNKIAEMRQIPTKTKVINHRQNTTAVKNEVYSVVKSRRNLPINISSIPLEKRLQDAVQSFIYENNHENFKVSHLCDYLIEHYDADSSTFSSGKLKIYPHVSLYLDFLAKKGFIELINNATLDDRGYRIVT